MVHCFCPTFYPVWYRPTVRKVIFL